MDISERIHIVPLGTEYDRIVQPLITYNADRALLVNYLPADVGTRPDTDTDGQNTQTEWAR